MTLEEKLINFKQYTIDAFPVINGNLIPEFKKIQKLSDLMIDYISKNEKKEIYSLTDICNICNLSSKEGMEFAYFLCNSVTNLFKPVYYFESKLTDKKTFINALKNNKDKVSFAFKIQK
ncbi:MAG: hypothetical protein CL760_06875 [Chloroflexi bacterium]|nr:hypothetical protein [Chloroflexota bacterium]|tara:strand:- start:87459 stop:87815 length:357 start_codon:yes stop_codon:yes gene_type:complete